MKKFLALFVLLLGMSGIAEAKYNAPEGIVSRSDKIASWQLGELDADGDGKLSLDEFKRKTENYGRDERRNVRRAKRRESICRRNNSLRLRIPTKTVSFPIPSWPSLSENSAMRTRGCIIKARGADY